MKKIKLQQLFFTVCLIIAGSFTSCSKQEEVAPTMPTQKAGYQVSLNAVIGEESSAITKGITRVTVAEDATNGLKTTWDSNDKLTVAYRSGGTLKTAELSVVSANGSVATFQGSVETSADAQAFKSSTLYAVNNNATDKIEVSLSDGKMKVNVDLSTQNGTANNVANYDVLYAEGTASERLKFGHKMSVMRLDFVPDASANAIQSITEASFIYVPSTSTEKSIFATSASFECGDGNISSSYSGVAFFNLSSVSLPYVNGKASAYIVVPANEPLTGELSLNVKGQNNDYFRKYLNLKGKSFPAQEVVARTVKLRSDDRIPRIGYYLYSDGTWGPLQHYSEKVPVALIFSDYTSPADRAKGYKHGYAVALRDAAWPTPWGPDNGDYPETPNLFENLNATAPLTMMNNLDGLTTNKTLNDKYLKNYNYTNHYSSGGKLAAIPLAMEYGGEPWKQAYNERTLVPAPAGTSGWYLPSIGQWFLMFANLSGLNPNMLQMGKDYSGNIYTMSWTFRSAAEKATYLKKFFNYFDRYFNPILGQYYNESRTPETTFYFPFEGQIHWYLWACDEAKGDGSACCVRLTETEIGFTYVSKTLGTTDENGYAARSVIAF